jgi:perosamine synthetase
LAQQGPGILRVIPVARPHMWGDELTYITEAIRKGCVSSRGEFVDNFEHRFARRLGRRYGVAVSNGTAALHLALVSLGIHSGDEVILPDLSMIAPVLAVMYCGATPVPIDVDETWNIDPSLIASRITRKTKAIVVVHNYGHPADLPRIKEIARAYGLPVVEDAAEVLGATIGNRLVGSFGEIACFSFYANKMITTGEGGMLVTDDPDVYRTACWKRDMCFGPDEERRFIHQEIGFNYRMTNLQAAVGVAQLEHFDEAVSAKRAIGASYNRALDGIEGLSLPPEAPWATNSFWVYGVVVEEVFGLSRRSLQRLLREAGIETRRFFSPVHRQPIFPNAGSDAEYPRSLRLGENGFYLPSFIGITPETVAWIGRIIRELHDGACSR